MPQMQSATISHTTRGMPETNRFHTFPNEILAHIFAFGCKIVYIRDSKDLFIQEGVRRAKLFAKIARSVCSRWRNVIEYQLARNSEFWILFAHSKLTAGTPVINIARFKRDMGRSQGADLVLRFEEVPEWSAYKVPFEDEQVTRLYIHGMYLINLFRNQLAVLRFNLVDRNILRHCFEILFHRSAPRLTTVLFPGTTASRSVAEKHTKILLPSFTDKIWDSGNIRGFESLRPKRLETPRTLKHLISLNTLQFSAIPWLEDFQCSSSIHLILNDAKIGNNLESFKLVRLSYLEFTGGFPLRTAPFELPGLRQLLIRTDAGSVGRFLTKVSLPALKIADVHINKLERYPGYIMREEYPTSNTFRLVTELNVWVKDEELCLRVLKHFIQSPLQKLGFNQGYLPLRQPSDEHDKLLKSTFRRALRELTWVSHTFSDNYLLHKPFSPDRELLPRLLKHSPSIQRLTVHVDDHRLRHNSAFYPDWKESDWISDPQVAIRRGTSLSESLFGSREFDRVGWLGSNQDILPLSQLTELIILYQDGPPIPVEWIQANPTGLMRIFQARKKAGCPPLRIRVFRKRDGIPDFCGFPDFDWVSDACL